PGEQRRAGRKESDDDGEETRLGPAVAVDEDDAAVERVAEEAGEARARRVDAAELRREADAAARGDLPQDRRVVVREADVRVLGAESVERSLEQRPRREEARRPLRIAVEVLGAEARRPRVVEVVAPRELREQTPED